MWEKEPHGRRGARRRIYRLTAKGGRKLKEGRGEWQTFVETLGAILGARACVPIESRLERIVALAVGPLWASRAQKRMIQEELLAHVTSVFEEELDRLGDEDAAFQETRSRFGIGEELESQLQQSVPLLERFLLVSEREVLMSRWFWLVAVFAVFFGPAIVLPALAKLRDHGELLWLPLVVGILITFAGLGGVGYGIVRRFVSTPRLSSA